MNISINGISGWDANSPAVEAAPNPELDTPEKRLAAVKEAIIGGNVEFAPDRRGGFVIQWSAEGVGFGEVTIAMDVDGSIKIDDEYMSKAFIREVLMHVLDAGLRDDEELDG
jgi:hypothetical protein